MDQERYARYKCNNPSQSAGPSSRAHYIFDPNISRSHVATASLQAYRNPFSVNGPSQAAQNPVPVWLRNNVYSSVPGYASTNPPYPHLVPSRDHPFPHLMQQFEFACESRESLSARIRQDFQEVYARIDWIQAHLYAVRMRLRPAFRRDPPPQMPAENEYGFSYRLDRDNRNDGKQRKRRSNRTKNFPREVTDILKGWYGLPLPF